MDESEVDLKFLYPNLIIFIGPNKNENLLKQLNRSFKEFKYGPIFKKLDTSYKPKLGCEISICRIMEGSVTLAEGEGTLPCDAESQAVERLMEKLRKSFYVIQANPDYFSKKKVPPCALDVDPSNSHIYKVVFLKKNLHGVPFPHPVSGAVDYVENYNELLEYIKSHAESDSKADLFILNVLKQDRASIKEVVQKNGLQLQNLVGCSDMGLYVFRNLSTLLILQDLLETGGKTVKYELIGPCDKFGDNNIEKSGTGEKVEAEEEEVVISPWIADHLVIMDVVDENNELESPKEIIWRSVRDCPDTQVFIIEKKRNDVSMIFAEAMIDRNVVGRARGFNEMRVKFAAADNAMQNLKKYCHYIKAKSSYFGTRKVLPNFLQQLNPTVTSVYRIAEKKDGQPTKILKEFKTSCQEDLYFRWNLSNSEKESILKYAKQVNFMVRWIGDSCLCVSKRRKPKEVLMDLLATYSKENEKYKLFIPSAGTCQQPEEQRTQYRNNERISHDTQGHFQTINKGQDPCNSSSLLTTQANTSEYCIPNVDHGVASQSSLQGGETSGGGKDEIPNWVRNFIGSAPVKPTKSRRKNTRSSGPARRKDDVYSRYNFIPPKPTPLPPFSSNMNYQRTEHKQDQSFKRENVRSCKLSEFQNDNSEKINTDLSGRLTQMSETYHQSGSQELTDLGEHKHSSSIQGGKRSYHQELGVEEESGYFKKIKSNYKLPTDSHSSQDESSFSRQNFKEEEESLNNYSQDQIGKKTYQSLSTWGRNINNRGFEDRFGSDNSYRRSFTEEGSSKMNSYTMFDSQVSRTPHYRNSSDQEPRIKVEEDCTKDTSQLFHRRPESTQDSSTSHMNIKQEYDQRSDVSAGGQHSLSNLFDYGSQDAEPQGSARPSFPPRPPPPWKNQSRGHNFSKIQKYGVKRGGKRPY